MSALDLLADDFPHGTVEGHGRGCRGSICPGRSVFGWSCAQALVRYRGDWLFRKRVDAGMGAADIAAVEAEERRITAQAVRALRRATTERTVSVPAPVARPATLKPQRGGERKSGTTRTNARPSRTGRRRRCYR